MLRVKIISKLISELPSELQNGGIYKGQNLQFTDPANGHRWFRPTTLSELSELQKSHATFRRFMGGTGGYKRDDFSYNHLVTVQLDGIEELVRINNSLKHTFHTRLFGSLIGMTYC